MLCKVDYLKSVMGIAWSGCLDESGADEATA